MKRLLSIAVMWLAMMVVAPVKAQATYGSPVPPASGWWEDRAGDGGGTHFPSADAACRNQHQVFNPAATYQSPTIASTLTTANCNWDKSAPGANSINPATVAFACPSGSVGISSAGKCISSGAGTSHGGRGGGGGDAPCGCPGGRDPPGEGPGAGNGGATGGISGDTGDSGAGGAGGPGAGGQDGFGSGSPSPEVGNPVRVADGAKTQREVDYSTADGLLTVRRSYSSLQGNDAKQARPSDSPGFGRNWRGILPGLLAVVGDPNYVAGFEYVTDGGSTLSFNATNFYDTTVWTFAGAQNDRASMTMVTVPTVNRFDYFRNGASVLNGPAEVRIDFRNGNYVLFRRAGAYNTASEHRYMVPIEQGFSSGYRQFFDYPDTGIYPDKVRDSFGRQLLLTWTDPAVSAGGAPNPVGKVISEIGLPDSSRLTYAYGSAGGLGYGTVQNRLQTVQRLSATSAVLWGRSYLYDNTTFDTALTGIVDQNGARLSTYTYSDAGLVATSERSGGVARHEFTYGEELPWRESYRTTVRNPLGRDHNYFFYKGTGNGFMPRILTKIDGAATLNMPADTRTWSYSGYDVTSATDTNGNRNDFAVDFTNHRYDSRIDAAGSVDARTTSASFDPAQDLFTRLERPGLRLNFTYSPIGQLLTRTETDTTTHTLPYSTAGQARTWTYGWTSTGKLASTNGPLPVTATKDDTQTFAYDALGNLSSVINGLGQVTGFAGYDANGRPATMTDANGIVTAFVYDGLGRTTSVKVKHPTTASLDATTTIDYDVEGRVTGITRPATEKLIVDYDLAGRVTAIRNPSGERIDYTLDPMGNVTAETTKRSNATIRNTVSRTFDEIGRMLSETLGPNRTTAWQYDKNGNATRMTSARSNATQMAFDGLDRLTGTIAADTGTTLDKYDPRDNLTEHTDAATVKTTFVRNGFGEVIQEVSPDRGTSTYYYNAAGQMTAAIDGRGQRVDYTRDILGRTLTKTPVGLTAQKITYTYDTAGITGSYGIGRLSKIVDGSGTTLFSYDHRGNLLIKRQKIGSTTAANVTWSYDLADRIATITYPSGRIVTYVRDTKGRVSSVTTKASGTAALVTLASGITYEAFGPLASATYGNGLSLTQDWGTDARLYAKSVKRVSTGANLWAATYAYDNDDNITGITDLVDATRSASYGYDVVDRLTRVVVPMGAVRQTDWTHDPNGNRTSEELRAVAGQANPDTTRVLTKVTGTNRLSTVQTATGLRTITYDARGNTSGETRGGGVSMTTTYDGYARLTGYVRTGDATQANVYNGLDDRVQVTSGTDVRRYLYDQDGRLIGDYGTSAADVKGEFIWLLPEVANDNSFGGDDGVGGYAPLAVASGPAASSVVSWLHGNHLGTPVLTTNASGTAVTPGTYVALGYPGQMKTYADLYYNRYRDYDTATGRYIQADPIGLAGDLNPYAYARGNPLRFVDPGGAIVKILTSDPRALRALMRAYLRLNRSKRGREITYKLESSCKIYYIKPAFHKAEFSGDTLLIDPFNSLKLWTTKGYIPTPLEVILGHELGHAFGTKDDGASRMNNVIINENQIRQQLGYPIRTDYFVPQFDWVPLR